MNFHFSKKKKRKKLLNLVLKKLKKELKFYLEINNSLNYIKLIIDLHKKLKLIKKFK